MWDVIIEKKKLLWTEKSNTPSGCLYRTSCQVWNKVSSTIWNGGSRSNWFPLITIWNGGSTSNWFPWLLKVHLQGESSSYTCLFGCMFTLLINSWRTVCTQELEFGVPNYTHFEVWTHLDVKMAVSFVGGCIRFHRCKDWRGKSTTRTGETASQQAFIACSCRMRKTKKSWVFIHGKVHKTMNTRHLN